jgi:hypothetical protein
MEVYKERNNQVQRNQISELKEQIKISSASSAAGGLADPEIKRIFEE